MLAVVDPRHDEDLEHESTSVFLTQGHQPVDDGGDVDAWGGPVDLLERRGRGTVEGGNQEVGLPDGSPRLRLPEQGAVAQHGHLVAGMSALEVGYQLTQIGVQGGLSRAGKGDEVNPMELAATALYVSCTLEGEDKTQRDVAEAAGVTEVTIRNRYKGLRSAPRNLSTPLLKISNKS